MANLDEHVNPLGVDCFILPNGKFINFVDSMPTTLEELGGITEKDLDTFILCRKDVDKSYHFTLPVKMTPQQEDSLKYFISQYAMYGSGGIFVTHPLVPGDPLYIPTGDECNWIMRRIKRYYE